MLTFEDCKLLPQSSGFQCKPVACDEQYTDVHNRRNDERVHRSDIYWSSPRWPQQTRGQSVDSATGSGFDDPHPNLTDLRSFGIVPFIEHDDRVLFGSRRKEENVPVHPAAHEDPPTSFYAAVASSACPVQRQKRESRQLGTHPPLAGSVVRCRVRWAALLS